MVSDVCDCLVGHVLCSLSVFVIDVVQALGESILGVIGCLVPFLETDILHSLPYTVAMTLAVLPRTLHKDVMELLCLNLLPVTLGISLCCFLTFYVFFFSVNDVADKTT